MTTWTQFCPFDHLPTHTWTILILMPYPCSQFYADVKFDIRFDNRFDIKLWNSFHVNHTIIFVTKIGIYDMV